MTPQSTVLGVDFGTTNSYFCKCPVDHIAPTGIDFGTGAPCSAPAGKEFDGARWNGLRYSRAAKELARKAAAERAGEEAKS